MTSRNPVSLSDEVFDDEPIYQPGKPDRKLIPGSRDSQRSGSSHSLRTPDSIDSNYLSPNRTPSPAGRPERRSPSPIGRSDLPRTPSPAGRPERRSPSPAERSSHPRTPSPAGRSERRSPSPAGRPNPPRNPSPSGNRSVRSPENRSVRSPDRRERRRSSGDENITHCSEPNCELCQFAMSKYRQNNFSVSTGEVHNPENYDPSVHTLKKNDPNKIPSSSTDPTRIKPHFAKKLAQLDATMKIIAMKVDNNIWEEKYLEAEELQSVLVSLRKVQKKLKELLFKREQNLNQDDFKGAHDSKVEYENALQEALDINGIMKLLSPEEISDPWKGNSPEKSGVRQMTGNPIALEGRTESYRAATMLSVEPKAESNNVAEKKTKTGCCCFCKNKKPKTAR